METKYVILDSNKKDSHGKSVFKSLIGNRKYKASEYLINSLKEDGQVYPVLCYEKNPGYYLIIDGQHRLDGLQKLKLPVELKVYKFDESDNEKQLISHLIRSANSTSKNWSKTDHINFMVAFEKDPIYTQFKQLLIKYKYLDANFLYTALRKEKEVNLLSKVSKDIRERKLSFDIMINESLLELINKLTFEIFQFHKGSSFSRTKRNTNYALYMLYNDKLLNEDKVKELILIKDENIINISHNYQSIYKYLKDNL